MFRTARSMKRALSVLALMASVGLASAEPPALIPRKVLFGNLEKYAPTISPDGKLLAYVAPDSKAVLNVWVRTLGQKDDHVVTSDRKQGLYNYEWQQDSAHILYFQDNDGDTNFHLYQTDVKGTNTRDLTPFLDAHAWQVAARLTNPRYPNQVLVAMNLRDRGFDDVYRVDLSTGAIQLDTENPGNVYTWTADNEMKVRVAQVNLPDGGTEIRIRETPSDPWRKFQVLGPEETYSGVPGFSADNRKMWVISSLGANAARLVEADLASGETTVVAEDKQFDVDSILTNPRTRALEAVRFVRARSEWTILDRSLQGDFDVLKQVRDGDITLESRDANDSTWIVSYNVDDGPIYYYEYDRAKKAPTLLFTHRPKLLEYQLAKMQPISFTARDGMTLHGYLTLPVGLAPKNLPLIIHVHGGPFLLRDVWGYDREVQWLANRGYAVLQINFRGSAGYGKEFRRAGYREFAGKMSTDLIDGKQWAIQQGYADPKRVCIYGGSYGGYATLVGVTFTPDEFVCGVDLFGYSNLVSETQSILKIDPLQRGIGDLRCGNIDTESDFLKSRSPLFKADQVRVPLFVAQGSNDPIVGQAESDQMVAAVRKNGREVQYLVFPDEGHGFQRPENNLKFYAAVEPFLAKYLGGRIEPAADSEKSEDLRH